MTGRVVAALGAAVVLNALLAFANVWPTLWVRPAAALSVEAALVVLLVAGLARRAPVAPRVLAALTALVVLMALARYADVTARALYGRPVNLYWDAEHLPRVAAMLAEAASPAELALLAGGAAAALTLLVAAARIALGVLARAAAGHGTRRALGAGAAAVIALYAAGSVHEGLARDRLFAAPVAPSVAAQAGVLAAAFGWGEAAAADAASLAPAGLAALGSADVYLVFLESYGAAALAPGAHRERLAPARERLAAAVAATGRHAASAYVTSPTFGGASWLAHASVMAARETRTPEAYNRLLASRGDTLAHAFARHGRRTVALMPGLRQAWPEGAFYGFDALHGASALDYRGPAFGWWRIPDQYALAWLEAREVAATPRAPLFVFFPTITSHAPFRPTPPYQPDWPRLLGAAPYDATVASVPRQRDADWTDLAPAYADAIGYTLTTLAGYLERRARDDLVMIVVGDHQPPAGVAGEGASWDVPVHVIANRASLLAPLVAAGFAPGLEPRAGSRGPLHGLGAQLLDAFSGRAGVHAGESRVHVARAGAGRELRE